MEKGLGAFAGNDGPSAFAGKDAECSLGGAVSLCVSGLGGLLWGGVCSGLSGLHVWLSGLAGLSGLTGSLQPVGLVLSAQAGSTHPACSEATMSPKLLV